MNAAAPHTVDRDELERCLTWQDRLAVFRRLGFAIPERKVKSEGWIDGLRLPPSIHNDTKAAASVDLATGGVKDHGGSGYSNNFFGFVQDARGCTFPEALLWIADETGHHDLVGASTTNGRRPRPRPSKIHTLHPNGSTGGDGAPINDEPPAAPKKPAWDAFRDGEVAAVYPYTDEHGAALYEVVRFEVRADNPAHPDKSFRQRRSDPENPKADNRGYVWNMDGVRLVPYQLPLILEAIHDGEPVFTCEGEKAVTAIERLGLTATCNSGGALKWTDEHSAHLKGADVVILPDNDERGRKHADAVAGSLSAVARSVKIVELPDLPEKGDAHEYVADGGTVRTLMQLVEAAPPYQPTPEPFYYRESKSNSVRINHARLVALLEHAGFGKLYLTGARESIFVRVEGKIAEEVSGEQIKDFVLDYAGAHPDVDSGDREAVRACLIRGANAYFSKYLLTCMAPLDLTFQRDTRKAGYVYYENGYVEVRAEGITFHDYQDLDGCVWREEIQPRRLRLIQGFDTSNAGEGDFGKFLWHVCRSADVETQQQRFLALFTTIGYLLHSYKDPSQARAVCFLDEKIGEGDALEGRCGKGLVLRAVGHVVPTLHIDARSFRFGEQFSFQQVRPGTRVIHFDDASRRFPFERLFSMITGDMQTEQKNRDQRTIPFALSPKFALSTNFVVEGEGGSHEDRIVEVEFSDYYNVHHKPVDDFGRRFFDEWDSQEWNHFDNLMLAALRAYLAQGLTGYAHVNLAARKLRQKTAPEFLVWAEELDVGKLHNKKALYQDFTLQYPDFREGKSKIEQRTLTAWLKLYAASFNLDVVESRSGSGSERYLTLIKPDIE